MFEQLTNELAEFFIHMRARQDKDTPKVEMVAAFNYAENFPQDAIDSRIMVRIKRDLMKLTYHGDTSIVVPATRDTLEEKVAHLLSNVDGISKMGRLPKTWDLVDLGTEKQNLGGTIEVTVKYGFGLGY